MFCNIAGNNNHRFACFKRSLVVEEYLFSVFGDTLDAVCGNFVVDIEVYYVFVVVSVRKSNHCCAIVADCDFCVFYFAFVNSHKVPSGRRIGSSIPCYENFTSVCVDRNTPRVCFVLAYDIELTALEKHKLVRRRSILHSYESVTVSACAEVCTCCAVLQSVNVGILISFNLNKSPH